MCLRACVCVFLCVHMSVWSIFNNGRKSSHFYADDTQLYISIKPDACHQLVKLEECILEIKTMDVI